MKQFSHLIAMTVFMQDHAPHVAVNRVSFAINAACACPVRGRECPQGDQERLSPQAKYPKALHKTS